MVPRFSQSFLVSGSPKVRFRGLAFLGQGFTLLELLVVVLVLSVVAGFVLVQGHGVLEHTYRAAMKNDLRHYAARQAAHHHRTGSFAEGPDHLQSFHFSPDVSAYRHTTQSDRFSLVVEHRNSSEYCWLKYGVTSLENGKILCGTPPPPVPTPTADFSVQGPAVMNHVNLHMDASPSGSGSSPLAGFRWQLGDGTRGEGVQIQKTYSDSGVYHVRLEVVNEEGWTDVRTVPLEVVKQWLHSPENFAASVWQAHKGVAVSGDGKTVTFESSSSRIFQSITGTTDPNDNGNTWETFVLEDYFQTFKVYRTSGGQTSVFEVRARGHPGSELRLLSDWNKECSSCSLAELTVQLAPGVGAVGTSIDLDYAIAYFQ